MLLVVLLAIIGCITPSFQADLKPGCDNLLNSLDEASESVRLNPLANIFERLCLLPQPKAAASRTPKTRGRAGAKLLGNNFGGSRRPATRGGLAGIFDPNLLKSILGGLDKLVIGGRGGPGAAGGGICYTQGDEIDQATRLDIIFRGLTEEPGQNDAQGPSCLTNNIQGSPLCLSTERNAIQAHDALRNYLLDCDSSTLRLRIITDSSSNDVGCPVLVSTNQPVWTPSWTIEVSSTANEGGSYSTEVADPVKAAYSCGSDQVATNVGRLRVARSLCLSTRRMLRTKCDALLLSVLTDKNKRTVIEECTLNNMQDLTSNYDLTDALKKCVCVEMAPWKANMNKCNAEQEGSPQCVSPGLLDTKDRFKSSYLLSCVDETKVRNKDDLSCLVQEDVENTDDTAEKFRNAIQNCDQSVLKMFVSNEDSCVYHVSGNHGNGWDIRPESATFTRTLSDSEKERATQIANKKLACPKSVPNENQLGRKIEENAKVLNILKTSCKMMANMVSKTRVDGADNRDSASKCSSLCRMEVLRSMNPDIFFKSPAPGGAAGRRRPPAARRNQGQNKAFLDQSETYALEIVKCAEGRMSKAEMNVVDILDPDSTSSCFAREVPPEC